MPCAGLGKASGWGGRLCAVSDKRLDALAPTIGPRPDLWNFPGNWANWVNQPVHQNSRFTAFGAILKHLAASGDITGLGCRCFSTFPGQQRRARARAAVAMVRFLNKDQRALALLMLDAYQPLDDIARKVGCSIRTCQRLKRLHDISGDPFPPKMSRFNALVLTPCAMEVQLPVPVRRLLSRC